MQRADVPQHCGGLHLQFPGKARVTRVHSALTRLKYYKVAGTDTVVPIMSLGDRLSKMSLRRVDGDPVVNALKRGNLPTLGDVKRSLKVYSHSGLFRAQIDPMVSS